MPGPELDDRLDRLLHAVAAGVTAGDPAEVARRGRRRRLARRAGGAGAVAALLAALVAVPTLLPDRPPGPAAEPVGTGPPPGAVLDRVVPWKGARLIGGPGRLTVTVDGGGSASSPSDPCWEGYQAEARTEPDRVVVTVRRFRSGAALAEGHGCASIGRSWNVTVQLPGDLGGRPVVDGATGKAKPVQTNLLAPLWLPRGWRQLTETAEDGERTVTYGPRPGAPGREPSGKPPAGEELLDQVEVVEIPPRLLAEWNRWPDTPVVGHTDVRGVRAEMDADPRDANLNVRWREGDRGYVVTGRVRHGTDPRRVEAVVVAIARGLRRPCEPPPALLLDSYPPQYREAGGGTRPDQSRCP